jgi:hypothetical protein
VRGSSPRSAFSLKKRANSSVARPGGDLSDLGCSAPPHSSGVPALLFPKLPRAETLGEPGRREKVPGKRGVAVVAGEARSGKD